MFSHYIYRWVKFLSTILKYIDHKKLFNQSQSIIYILSKKKTTIILNDLENTFFFVFENTYDYIKYTCD